MPLNVKSATRVPALGNLADSSDALSLANKVTAENYHCPQGRIDKNAKWRIDRQPPSRTHANIQIQRNGTDRPSTVACVIVPFKYRDDLQTVSSSTQKQNMSQELCRAINSGLHRSEKSRAESNGEFQITVFEVTGEFSSFKNKP